MGYYIEVPQDTNKAEQLRDLYGGEIVQTIPIEYDKLPEGKALIVVVANPTFEAAGFCHDEQEFIDFIQMPPIDFRPKKFVLMDRKKAEELSGYFNPPPR